MKKIIFVITILFIHCTNGASKKAENTIPASKMIKILKERQLIISKCNTYQYQAHFEQGQIDSLLKSTYIKLGYSDQDFQQSWDSYLNQGNQELHDIYDSILVQLQKLQEESRN